MWINYCAMPLQVTAVMDCKRTEFYFPVQCLCNKKVERQLLLHCTVQFPSDLLRWIYTMRHDVVRNLRYTSTLSLVVGFDSRFKSLKQVIGLAIEAFTWYNSAVYFKLHMASCSY